MLYLLLVVICFVICLVVDIWAIKKYNKDYDNWWPILSILAGIWLIISLICIPIDKRGTLDEIAGFEAVKTTVLQQRSYTNDNYERATLTIAIIEKNEWLAKKQSRKQRQVFSVYIPDEIMDVEPIK